MSEVFPARGNGRPLPSELPAECFAVIAFTGGGQWELECFVVGATSKAQARDEAAEWLGADEPRRLLATKIGGNSGKLEVIEPVPPPPPEVTVREWDPSVDEPAGEADWTPEHAIMSSPTGPSVL